MPMVLPLKPADFKGKTIGIWYGGNEYPYHMPMVLPLKSAGFLMPVSARHVSSRPDFLNVCEILTSGTPFSRDARADGIQSTTTSAPPPAITCGGATSGPPGLIVTSSPASL